MFGWSGAGSLLRVGLSDSIGDPLHLDEEILPGWLWLKDGKGCIFVGHQDQGSHRAITSERKAALSIGERRLYSLPGRTITGV